MRVRTGAPAPPFLGAPLEGAPPRAPLVRVRAGAGAAPVDGAGRTPTPLVLVRGAEVVAGPLDTPERDPLAAVRGGKPLTLVPPPETAPAVLGRPCVAGPRGGRSWRTICTVRLITCVRTSAACWFTCVAVPVVAGDERSANAARTPAASVEAKAAILVLLTRRDIDGSLGVCTLHCARCSPRGRPTVGKALAKRRGFSRRGGLHRPDRHFPEDLLRRHPNCCPAGWTVLCSAWYACSGRPGRRPPTNSICASSGSAWLWP